jgi:hypothetical protein
VPNSAAAVFDLVPEIVAGRRTPYAKTEAVVRYLTENCRYDDLAARVPRAADVADYFLTKSKRGACDQFATAAALLCRAAGVPSRIVIGYVLEGPLGAPNRYVARERDAHAWIEVLIPGYGWIPVDPTAGSSRAREGTGFFEEFFTNTSAVEIVRWVRRNAFWAVFAVLAAYLLWLLYAGWREDRRAAAAGRRPLSPGQRTVVAAYLSLCRRLRRLGLSRDPAQTPAEFLATLRADPRLSPAFLQGATELTEHFCRVRYAELEPDPDSVRLAVQLRRALPKLLKAAARRS